MSTTDDFWTRSSQPWIDRVDQGDPNRTHLLDAVVERECGTGVGKRLLDVGCGEGRFCRMAQARGFETVGIDPTEALIEVARARDREGDYRQEPAEALSLESAAFDVVLSYLTLCDIGEFETAIKEMARVTKPGGKIIAVNVNTAMGVGTGWVKDVTGKKLHWPLDGYAFESGMRVAWCGIEIVNYHRPLSMYMQAFLSEGLRLTNFQEPIPSPQAMLDYPGLRDSLRLPNFWVMTWQKP